MPNDENIYRIITSRAPVVTGAAPAEAEWNTLLVRVYDETPGFSKVHPRSGWVTTSNDAYLAHTDVLER